MTPDATLILADRERRRRIAEGLYGDAALTLWRLARWNEAQAAYDTLPPGAYEFIWSDTPQAMAERMQREAA